MNRRKFVFLLSTVLSGCTRYSAAVIDRTPKRIASTYRVVRKDDTLYSIAWQNGLDYKYVAKWNQIKAPYVIHPGQILRLRPPVYTTNTTKSIKKKRITSPRTKSNKRKTTAQQKYLSGWVWPIKGKLIGRFSIKNGINGIRIAAKYGASVKATQSGEVVYVGQGLWGYGRLIIVKHMQAYLSAYAHNSRILVKEGDRVKKGQQIAQLGRSGTNRVMLHFEIRKYGKPVNPLHYLPRL